MLRVYYNRPFNLMLPSPRLQRIGAMLESRGQPGWRLKQIARAIYSGHVSTFSTLPDVPKELRHWLADLFGRDRISTLSVVGESAADSAHKVLFACEDGARIEAVGLKFKSHHSLCISSQVGCAFACAFCATGKIGFKRQLSVDEITDQILFFRGMAGAGTADASLAIDSVSFMGMGEPLANPAVFAALDVIRDGLGVSERRLNVSTIGIIPGIRKLNESHKHVNLAYSLHSPFPAERLALMPIQKAFPLEAVFELLDA